MIKFDERNLAVKGLLAELLDILYCNLTDIC